MTDEERKATDESAARVDAAKAKFAECMAIKSADSNKNFI